MSDMDLSPAAKALLRAARTDTPSGAARSRIWSGVSSGLGGVPAGGADSPGAPGAPADAGLAASGGAVTGAAVESGAGAAAAALKGAGFLGGSKLLAVGALFGSTVTVGLAATLIGLGSTPRLGPDPQEAPVAALVASPSYGAGSAGWSGGRAAGASVAGERGERAERERAASGGAGSPGDGASGSVAPERGARSTSSGGHGAGGADVAPAHGGGAARGAHARVAPEDALMRESALVAEARGAFMRRDYEKALAALHVTHGLVHRELEPEELSLEAHALRAVGRDAEADAAEATLRSRFPDHALSR